MRTFVLTAALLALVLPAAAQQAVTTVRDINGNRVEWSQASRGDGRSALTTRNLNGRRVPLEEVKETVVRKEGNTVVVERLIKRYDNSGAPLPPEKQLIETTTSANGASTEKVTTYRGNINGVLTPVERTVTDSTKSGDTTDSQTVVERVSINGGFQAAERRTTRETATKTASERDVVVYTPDTNGQFNQSARTVTRSRIEGNQTSTQVDEYEAATTGSLKLFRQTVGSVVKNPDGTERQEYDIYGNQTPGRAPDPTTPLQLRERQIYTSRQSADGATVQVFAIQRPTPTSLGSKELGPVQQISETTVRKQ